MRVGFSITLALLSIVACADPVGETPEATSNVEAVPSVPIPQSVDGGRDVPMPPSPRDDGILSVNDVDFASYSLALAEFMDLKAGEQKSSVEGKVYNLFKPNTALPAMPNSEQGNAEYFMTELKAKGGSVLVATADGLVDDSVKAQQFYAVFKDELLVTYGMKLKCWRAENKDIWQVQPCP